ncbi:MAG: hypothetical protein RLZ16_619 [Bacteroidota bacterium]|jgi:hypothetical protein
MIKSPTLFGLLLKSLLAMYLVLSLVSCANIVPPSGGPRDSIPPYLLVAKPKDSAVNVQPKEIWLAFNEYITTTSIQENVIVSPSLKNNPLISSKLNVLRIRIADTLLPNTTYSLQFGNAIKDVNEGNIAENYTYAFSTGNTLDTGSLGGTIQLAETGRFDSTLLVVLHPAGEDTAIYKNKPLYYTRLNKQGKFKFSFLPNKAFTIFVVPNDFTKKYDDSTKLFAFGDTVITIAAQNAMVKLYAFQAYKKTEKKKLIPLVSGKKDAKQAITAIKYNKSLEGLDQDLLIPLSLTFETPIQLNDSFPIQLCDTNNLPVGGYKIILDSTTKQKITIEYPWVEQTKMHLIVPKNGISDSLKNTLVKSDTLRFITKSTSSYGASLIRITGYQQFVNPILLLTKDDKVLYSYPILKNLLNIPLLPPNEYTLKILEDRNGNGIWDTGKYDTQKIQPEIVHVLKDNLLIKPNWENELNLTINK